MIVPGRAKNLLTDYLAKTHTIVICNWMHRMLFAFCHTFQVSPFNGLHWIACPPPNWSSFELIPIETYTIVSSTIEPCAPNSTANTQKCKIQIITSQTRSTHFWWRLLCVAEAKCRFLRKMYEMRSVQSSVHLTIRLPSTALFVRILRSEMAAPN